MLRESDVHSVIDAWPARLSILLFWFGYLLGLLVLVPAYYFENNSGLVDKLITALVYAIILLLFFFLFLSASIVLFTWVPIVRIAEDKLSLPLIGLVISRGEVLRATRQSSKVSDHWRVSIELKAAKLCTFRAWLLFPTAYAVGKRIYIFPLFLTPHRGVIQQRIVEALSPYKS